MAEKLTSIEPLLAVVRQRPLGVLSDVDGTLAPIVERPEEATVPEETRALLRELSATGVRVGVITGRSLEDARRMVGLEDVAYATEHGLRLSVGGRETLAPEVIRFETLAVDAEEDLRGLAERFEGVQTERKGPVLAVHYRRAADRDVARRAILDAVSESWVAERFRVQEGRMVVELRPPLDTDKGTALEALAERLGLRGLLCMGDDVTDIDMFRAARGLRGQGIAAASIAVASTEATPEVSEAADYRVEGIEGVRWLLSGVVEAVAG